MVYADGVFIFISMMNFKFLSDNFVLNDIYEPDNFTFRVEPNDVPTHYYRTNVRREDIPESTWYNVLRQQRQRLTERLWEEGLVSHSIISQDENGFTLMTEFLL